MCDREIAPADAYVNCSPRLRQPKNVAPVAGPRSGNRPCNRRTYFWKHGGGCAWVLFRSRKQRSAACVLFLARLSSSCPLPSASRLPCRCNQVEQLKYSDEEILIARENVNHNFTRRYVLFNDNEEKDTKRRRVLSSL